MKSNFWYFIWWLAETFRINLGRFAPYVFGKMIGCKGSKVEDKYE